MDEMFWRARAKPGARPGLLRPWFRHWTPLEGFNAYCDLVDQDGDSFSEEEDPFEGARDASAPRDASLFEEADKTS